MSSFSLASTSGEPIAFAGGEIIEDPAYPWNTAIGYQALYSNTLGHYNTASGYQALCSNTVGNENTAIGSSALYHNWQGDYNTAIGYHTGYLCQEGNYNIYLGAKVLGKITDTNKIRIGSPYDPAGSEGPTGQNQTFIAGIFETELLEGMMPVVVGVTSEGRLGTMSSDLLPQEPPGEQGPPGPQGPAGEGLISGSLLLLPPSIAPPDGYVLLGTTELIVNQAGNAERIKMTINIYQKQ